jgi:hypothetical protein
MTTTPKGSILAPEPLRWGLILFLKEMIIMSTDSETILNTFTQYLQSEGKGAKTILSYCGDIRAFLRWLESEGQTFRGTFTRFHLTRYLDQLREQNYTHNTINKKVNSIHCFNHFLINQKLMQEKVAYPNKDKVKIARGSESEVIVFSDAEVEQLLFHLEDREQFSFSCSYPWTWGFCSPSFRRFPPGLSPLQASVRVRRNPHIL